MGFWGSTIHSCESPGLLQATPVTLSRIRDLVEFVCVLLSILYEQENPLSELPLLELFLFFVLFVKNDLIPGALLAMKRVEVSGGWGGANQYM